MDDGAAFPPVTVFSDGHDYWLADGFHRIKAAERIGKETIEAEIQQGGRREAILHSVGVNATHGLRRTNDDKRRAVMTLLNDTEGYIGEDGKRHYWYKWSDREIARRCAVHNSFVSRLRASLSTSDSEPRTYTTKHGTTATMDTSAIGRKSNSEHSDQEDFDLPETEPPKHSAKSKPTFNRTNDNIKWAKWTWNPVTGCKHNCPYCYAQDIANRFTGCFEPEFHEDRLEAPGNTKPDSSIPGGDAVFVCSMGDLFGCWVPNDWIWQVMRQVENNPQWTFLFLTKNPRRYESVQFPENAWIGATVDRQNRVELTEKALANAYAPVRFVSCEPLLEEITFSDMSMIDWLIIGAQSRTSGAAEFQPEWSWVWSLLRQAHEAKTPVYWKDNLKVKPEEYPEQDREI
jgi:protein gp37